MEKNISNQEVRYTTILFRFMFLLRYFNIVSRLAEIFKVKLQPKVNHSDAAVNAREHQREERKPRVEVH